MTDFTKYGIPYKYGESEYAAIILATSMEDAAARFEQVKKTGKLIGEIKVISVDQIAEDIRRRDPPWTGIASAVLTTLLIPVLVWPLVFPNVPHVLLWWVGIGFIYWMALRTVGKEIIRARYGNTRRKDKGASTA